MDEGKKQMGFMLPWSTYVKFKKMTQDRGLMMGRIFEDLINKWISEEEELNETD